MDEKITYKNTNFIKNFLTQLKKTFSYSNLLAVDSTHNEFFDIKELSNNNIIGSPKDILNKIDENSIKYDLIFNAVPFNVGSIDWKKIKLPIEYVCILQLLKNIKKDGTLITILPVNVLFSIKGREFEKNLNSLGYHFSAVFSLPSSFFAPYTSIKSIILLIKAGKSDDIYISGIDYISDFEILIDNYSKNFSKSMEDGLLVKRSDFTSFDNYKTNQQISRLQTQYKNYTKYILEEIIEDINTTATDFEYIENSIYIPKLGTSLPVADIEKTSLKHQNYFQLSLKMNIVNAFYLEIFFKSQMGLLTLESLKRRTFIPHVNKSDLLKIEIPVPDIKTQELIIQTSRKIQQLEEEILNFESQLSLNPNSANKIRGILNDVLLSLGKLNEEDQILELIRRGESKILEFKQTFSKDIDTNIKEKEKSIRESSLKNIVGFLNTDGGTLLIGIKDNGEIFGIENDNYENDDKYLLNFKNNIKEHIGEDSYAFVEWKIVLVGNKKILKVNCERSIIKPFFLNDIDFYIRSNPSIDKLVGIKLSNYLQERFPK